MRFALLLTLGTISWSHGCKPRSESDVSDLYTRSTHYWSEGDYYFRGECSEGQAPSRSCKNNLSSLSKNEIEGVQKRLGQVKQDKELLKELGLESVVTEADKLQEDYSSKLKLLADLSYPTVSREIVSDEEKSFVDRLFRGRAAFLDIKSLSIFGNSICIVTNNDLVLHLSPKGQKWEGVGRSVQAIGSGCTIVEPNLGKNVRFPRTYKTVITREIPENVLEVIWYNLFCVTFLDEASHQSLACSGSYYSSNGFVMSDDTRIEKKIDYSLSRTLARARKSLKVALGGSHLCSVSDESALFCEGVNSSGQLGTGDRQSRSQRVAVLTNVVDVAASDYHTCAVQKGGVLRCWGDNEEGQLGHNHEVSKATDDKSVVMHGVRRVVARHRNTCAILENKDLYCWGNIPNEYVSGQNQSENPKSTTNLKINFIHKDVLDVAVSYENICALIKNEGLKCWGKNESGLLDTEDKYYGDQPGETLDKLPTVLKYEGTPN